MNSVERSSFHFTLHGLQMTFNFAVVQGYLGAWGIGVPILAGHFYFHLQMLRFQVRYAMLTCLVSSPRGSFMRFPDVNRVNLGAAQQARGLLSCILLCQSVSPMVHQAKCTSKVCAGLRFLQAVQLF